MSDISVGEIVSTARQRAGLTQAELAERAGTTQSAIARLESNQASPTFATIKRIAAAAGCEVRLELVPTRRRDPVIEAYKRDVDRTLLRENLHKTVDRRLRDMDALREAAAAIRQAGIRKRARS
jgi:transcriptional regulator with XRE-family HTH domain